MPPVVKTVPLEAGTRLADRYLLQKQLGQGSMAEVWQAKDQKIGRPVAIKVVAELLAMSDQARRRFANEVQAIGRIHHPNVVALFGHGRAEDGRPFLVMERVSGQTLQTYIDGRPPLSPHSAVRLASEILNGLAAAHAQAIIHRDLKPANIMLALMPNGKRQVKILDFGVARVIDAGLDPQDRLTKTGTMLGSPRYMSLEVARGSPEVDARADVFALGAVTYHTLTGHAPFEGTAMGQIIRRIIDHDFKPLAEERPDLCAELVAVLNKAMAHQPGDRYSSAQGMLDDLISVDLGPYRPSRPQQS